MSGNNVDRVRGKHFATGALVEVAITGGTIVSIGQAEEPAAPGTLGDESVWLAPGLFDSQINGFGGFDFNASTTTPDEVGAVIRKLWESGVTRLCPTVTTQSHARIISSLRAIRQAIESDPQIAHACVTLHIEGPYISSEDGPRGAHPREHTRPPDLDEFQRFREAAGGRIGYVTLAPELPGAVPFIERLARDGVVMALGHHGAPTDAIRAAVDAGASHCTHLGNGAHAQLPRHPNYIWEQLAEDRLTAGLIVDGHHLPAAVVKSMFRGKGLERVIMVSDAISLAGMPPGRYPVEGNLDREITPAGRIQVADTPYLAGSGLRLNDGLGLAVQFAGISLAEAIPLATRNPARRFGIAGTYGELAPGYDADLLLYRWDEAASQVQVAATIAAGQVVYQG